jgi:ribosomal protein S18 acetylase RimI-like enzyme
MTIQNLNDFVSKTGQTYSVKHCSTIAHTPVLPFFLRSLSDVIERGFADSLIVGTNGHSAIYVEFNQQVVACLVYTIPKDANILWKLLTAVNEQHRNQGIAKHLSEVAEVVAVKQNCIKIQSTVHKDNTDMIAVNLASGMTSDYLKFNKDLSVSS